MTIPHTNYVVDTQGEKIVQLSLKDWENFVMEFKRVESLLTLKTKLKSAFREIQQIQKGDRQGATLTEFLKEF